MPRNGAGVYSLPGGSTITNGDVSDASDLNTPFADLVTDANAARPIVAGGTGAATAADALTNLGLTATAAELNILDGVTATAAELNTLDGITATVTELNYTDGVTSNIQTQLDAKAPLASPALTGTPTAPTAATTTDTTQVATTAFVQQEIATIPAATSTLALLDRTVISGTPANVDFTFDATNYDKIVIELANIVPATDGADLWLRTSADGGSTYDSGSSNYEWLFTSVAAATSPVVTPVGDNADAQIVVATGVGSAGGEDGVFGTVNINAPSLAKRTAAIYSITYPNTAGAGLKRDGFGTRLSSAAVDAVRFLWSSGNFEDGGIISVYGVRNS